MRRGFVVAAANAVACIFTIVIALHVESLKQLYFFGVCSAIMQAMSEAVADTILVDRVKQVEESERISAVSKESGGNAAARMQATAFGTRTVASFIASFVSTPLLKVFSVRTMILIPAIFYFLAVLLALWMGLSRVDEKELEKSKTSPVKQMKRLWSAISKETVSVLNGKKRPSRIIGVVLFLFLLNCTPTVQDVYSTWAYSKLKVNWQFSLLGNISSAGAFASEVLFAAISGIVTRNLRFSFAILTILSGAVGVTRIIALRLSQHLFLFLVMDNFLTTMFSRLALLATATIATVWAPTGFEGLGYNAVISAMDAGQEVSTQISASVVKRLHLGAPPSRSWKNMESYIWITYVLKMLMLLPILLIPIEPKKSRYLDMLREGEDISSMDQLLEPDEELGVEMVEKPWNSGDF